MSENLHPVRRVSVGGLSADIDEELAPIVEVIWRLGLTTAPVGPLSSYDRAEILRRLTAYEAGRLTPPGPIDRSSMAARHLA